MTSSAIGFRGFSCPQQEYDQSVIEIIAAEYARAIIGHFVSIRGAALNRSSEGLISLVERTLGGTLPFDAIWDPLIGDIWLATPQRDDRAALRCAAELALRMHEAGEPGEWSARFDHGVQLMCGNWRFPPAVDVWVTSSGESTSITTSLGGLSQKITLRRENGRWEADRAAERLPILDENGCRIVVLDDVTGWSDHIGAVELSKIPPQSIRDYLSQSVSTVRDNAPDYLTWIARVVRYVVPVSPSMGQMISGSVAEKLGSIACSFPSSPIPLAEALVHESSHQYFYLATRVGPVDDGSDSQLYYSPIKRQTRPIHKILLTYHAFANVLLLYRSLLVNGFHSGGYVEKSERQLRDELRELDVHLRENKALTDLGRDLWEPLAELIHLG